MGLSYPTALFELLIIGRFFTGLNAGKYFQKYIYTSQWNTLVHNMSNNLDEYLIWTTNVALHFYRHWPLCSNSVFGGNSSDCTSWRHGSGNVYFHYCWDIGWTGDGPEVRNAGYITFFYTKNFKESVFFNWSDSVQTSVWFHRELLGEEEYWPLLLSTTCVPAFLQLLILPWFPESPRYLLIDRGDEQGCEKGTSTAEHVLSSQNVCDFSFAWRKWSDTGNLLFGFSKRDPVESVEKTIVCVENDSHHAGHVFVAALKQLHGRAGYDAEREDIEKERNNLVDFQTKTPWQLFTDRSVRWQLVTIVLLNAAQQLNGINAVSTEGSSCCLPALSWCLWQSLSC